MTPGGDLDASWSRCRTVERTVASGEGAAMSDRGDGRQSELDAGDLAALRKAMEGLGDSDAVPAACSGAGVQAAVRRRGVVGERVLPAHLRPRPPRDAGVRRGGITRRRCYDWTRSGAPGKLRPWIPCAGRRCGSATTSTPNLAVLFSSSGPFGQCTAEHHVRSAVLPVTAPPPGWWSASQRWWDVLGETDR